MSALYSSQRRAPLLLGIRKDGCCDETALWDSQIIGAVCPCLLEHGTADLWQERRLLRFNAEAEVL